LISGTVIVAPVAIAATNILQDGFTANWNAVTGATKYYLDVATDAQFNTYVAGYQNKDVGNALTYLVTGLTVNVTYYYRIRVYDGISTSLDSNIISLLTVETVVDGDGNVYTVITVGPLQWLKEDWKYNSSGSRVYDDDLLNEEKYGRLYTWDQANALVLPDGWRIPSQQDWLDNSVYLSNLYGILDAQVGGKMKEVGYIYWNSPNTGADNETGLSMRGGGEYYCSPIDVYAEKNEKYHMWFSTEDPGDPTRQYCSDIEYNMAGEFYTSFNKIYSLSVRLIRDTLV
jgi:uncharacterized protein (TIGR02145 family)